MCGYVCVVVCVDVCGVLCVDVCVVVRVDVCVCFCVRLLKSVKKVFGSFNKLCGNNLITSIHCLL